MKTRRLRIYYYVDVKANSDADLETIKGEIEQNLKENKTLVQELGVDIIEVQTRAR